MSSLDDPKVLATLDRLHAAARGDWTFFVRNLPMMVGMILGQQGPPAAEQAAKFKDVYIPISRTQGRFLYMVARSVGAKRIVEFGTSFGVSTIYAAAAARDTGGTVIGTELEPSKRERALANIAEAGLADLVDVRLGDALETLRDVPPPIDLVLLDGWKDLYLPVLRLLESKLRPGAVVLSDNIKTFRRSLGPFLDYVQSGRNGFHSLTLPLADGFEYSVRL
ncbi:MAG TPA: class I SAM-dependent methyltransferase [Candidatus Eisenbacteria bacterium]|nr:class I SAM-dependent methyltransferase [Candidatus Eisenbacteria bacterium]